MDRGAQRRVATVAKNPLSANKEQALRNLPVALPRVHTPSAAVPQPYVRVLAAAAAAAAAAGTQQQQHTPPIHYVRRKAFHAGFVSYNL